MGQAPTTTAIRLARQALIEALEEYSPGAPWHIQEPAPAGPVEGTLWANPVAGMAFEWRDGVGAGASEWAQVATSPLALRAQALDLDGNAWGWGAGGLLGHGEEFGSNVPVRVHMPEGVRFTRLAVGGYHALALDEDGRCWAWGDNSRGQLGTGDASARFVPDAVQMPEGVRFVEIAAGTMHSLAIDEDGVAWAWGDNRQGQLGVGDQEDRATPAPVVMPGGTGFVQVAGSQSNSAAVGADGLVYTWGSHVSAPGYEAGAVQRTPRPVAGPHGVTAVSAGVSHMLCLAADGTVWAWGENSGGQLGDGTTIGRPALPEQVAIPAGVVVTAVAAGRFHGLALDERGRVWAWGLGADGRLGRGEDHSDAPTPVRVPLPAGLTPASIQAGQSFSMALGDDGTSWAWGHAVGLARGSLEHSGTPVRTGFRLQWIEVTRASVVEALAALQRAAVPWLLPPELSNVATNPRGRDTWSHEAEVVENLVTNPRGRTTGGEVTLAQNLIHNPRGRDTSGVVVVHEGYFAAERRAIIEDAVDAWASGRRVVWADAEPEAPEADEVWVHPGTGVVHKYDLPIPGGAA